MSDFIRPTRFSRLLSRCYPRELREQYADDIARFIDDARRDPKNRNNPFGTLTVASRLTVDALHSLLAPRNGSTPRRNNNQSLAKTFRSFSMDSLLQDIRFSLRGFARRPAFTAVAIITLMLGIGANSAIFTLVNSVLLRPLPYQHPEELVNIWGSTETGKQLLLPVPDLLDMREQSKTFQDIGIARSQSVNLTGTDRPDRVVGNFVTASTLRILNARPAMGRIFNDDDTKIGAGQQVTVISWSTWQTRFVRTKTSLEKHSC